MVGLEDGEGRRHGGQVGMKNGAFPQPSPSWRESGGFWAMMAPGTVGGGTRMAVAGLDELGMQTIGELLFGCHCWVSGWHVCVCDVSDQV